MDETHDKDQPEEEPQDASPEERPDSEDAAAQPAPGSAEPQSNADSDGETPDAIKAAGDQPIAGDAPTAESGGASEEEITINEPSMDFSNPVPASDPSAEVHRAEFPQLGDGAATGVNRNIQMLMDVRLPVSIELGRTTLSISDILQWGQGSVVELDKLAGEPVDLLVNNKLVAKGEVVVIDEKFGMRITSLIAPPDPVVASDANTDQGDNQ